jgi:hypothetical protein
MMSYMTSAVWSHLVLSLCCTEHGTYRGAILSGRITSITMSRSGQLGRRYTVEIQCSDTWQRRSSPQYGGEVWGHGTCDDTGAHLCREMWSKDTAYVVARGCTHYSLS